ncbi:MAG TPA: sigma-70 family RNA polymerase sigma factor [bacterium]|nr:sigma-70 family RNA polymerase sigma factor [bacterium]
MAHDQQADARTITRRIRAGDEAAFTRFYELWFAPALALARAVSRRDEHWCLDVVQDVMMAVAERIPVLGSDEQLRAWLARSVVNAVTDRVRSEQRRERRERCTASAADDPAEEPWQQLAADERRQWLLASVAELSLTERDLLTARFGGLGTVTEVAARLGISADAAHGRLRRALVGLRRRAREWWHGR